ncbi:MAG: ATP-binding cassette domain-containing protein [Verrucomicrobiales bacterium]|nr:ATP-binding cassette domain-containing protein [Verrucomicrobiales bacterium]
MTRHCCAVVALDSIETTFEPGRIAAFVGANGAGRCTPLRILAGAVEPDSSSPG